MHLKIDLKRVLEEKGMTQARFAELSGLSQNAVSTLVNQPQQIRLETVERICNTLNIKPEDLFLYDKGE